MYGIDNDYCLITPLCIDMFHGTTYRTNKCIRPFLLICCSILRIWLVSFSLLFFFWQYQKNISASWTTTPLCWHGGESITCVGERRYTSVYFLSTNIAFSNLCGFISPQKGENWQWYIAHCSNWSQGSISTFFQFLVCIDLPFLQKTWKTCAERC